jgi:hypothetical protein
MVPSLNRGAWTEAPADELASILGADLPRRLFHCRLDDQPDHLVPERFLRDWESLADRPLFMNPAGHLVANGELPSALAASAWLLSNFALTATMVWIHDQVHQAVLPFWLGPEFSGLLAGSKAGDRAPSKLSSDARRILGMAEVLVPGDHALARSQRLREAISRCAAQYEAKRYTPVGRLIHPFHISALRRYYRHLLRQGQFKLGDSQSPRRYTAHNEPVARFFHHQLTATISRIVEEPVKPSYVYLGSYQAGAELEAHIDREQCEFSISLCVDYSPEPVGETPWPLWLHGRTGKTAVFQGIGDALIYGGRELPHSRDRLPLGNSSTSLFFHYVRDDFAGKLT